MRALVVQHTDSDGPGWLGDWLTEHGIRLDVRCPYAGDELPSRIDADLFVVLGGEMGAHDDDVAPWLPAVRDLLATAVADRLPTLGICLGAQLLAVACGGEVRRGPAGPEVGVSPLVLTAAAADDPVFGGAPARLPALQWHWDAVTALPPDATLLAGSAAYAYQVFRVGDLAWGVQPHPEVSAEVVAEWASADAAQLAARGIDAGAAVASLEVAEAELAAVWHPLVDRLVATARRVAEAAVTP
jgi:GMP synthase-like glutamine amidotransferase